MNNFSSLSIIIIVKNEEKNIADCLKTAKWAEEIILVDSGSTDKTLAVARKTIPSIKIITTRAGSFSDWRNLGLKEAKGKWIFYQDADERITPALQKEIITVIEIGSFDYFMMPRLNNLLGKDMKHGGWYPDYVTRLFRKDKLKGWQGKIHESPKAQGKRGKLKNHLYHLTHRDISSMVLKSLEWSRIEAELYYDSGFFSVGLKQLIFAPIKEFLRRIFWLRGFQDGIEGWIEAGMQAFNKFLTFSQLWEMKHKK